MFIISLFLSRSGLVLRQRGESQVWLDDSHLGPKLLGLLGLDDRSHNHVVARHPVDGGGDLPLVTGLQGVDDTEHLGGVAAGRRRV